MATQASSETDHIASHKGVIGMETKLTKSSFAKRELVT